MEFHSVPSAQARDTQNSMYSSYVCDMTVHNNFAHSANGKGFFCALNFPGSRGDDALIAQFIPFIKEWFDEYKINADQGYSRWGIAHDILVGPVS